MANCYACGVVLDHLDEDEVQTVDGRLICNTYDCEQALKEGPEPPDNTPSLDTSFHDHEMDVEEPPDQETILTDCYWCGVTFDTGCGSPEEIGRKPDCGACVGNPYEGQVSHAGMLEA